MRGNDQRDKIASIQQTFWIGIIACLLILSTFKDDDSPCGDETSRNGNERMMNLPMRPSMMKPETDCASILYPKDNRTKFELSPWKFQYYGPDPRIEEFDPMNFPLFNDATRRPLRVRFVLQKFRAFVAKHEALQVMHGGLLRSPLFQLQEMIYLESQSKVPARAKLDGVENDDLWVVDIQGISEEERCKFCCNVLLELVQNALQQRSSNNNNNDNGAPLYILSMDYADPDQTVKECAGVAALVQWPFYRVTKRSIVNGRRWKEEIQFPIPGDLMDSRNNTIIHTPYPVRNDLVAALAESLILQLSEGPNYTSFPDYDLAKMSFTPEQIKQLRTKTPFDMERPWDVAHFYARQIEGGMKMFFDNLRNGVNTVLVSLDGHPVFDKGCTARPLKSFAGIAGVDKIHGRNRAHPGYAERLLQVKIVVVAQRDAWVGHYRLMEALISGAMVIADSTQVLAKGLRHGDNLILYNSLDELRYYVLYYLNHEQERLEMARKGWEVAMGYLCSWHTMESAVFGEPQSRLNEGYRIFEEEMAKMMTPS